MLGVAAIRFLSACVEVDVSGVPSSLVAVARICAVLALLSLCASAAARTVHNTEQLIQALRTAQNQPRLTFIELQPGRYRVDVGVGFSSDHGASAFPVIRTPVTLVGRGAAATILDGAGQERRLFTVEAGGLLNVMQTGLVGGVANAYDDASIFGGGAIANFGGQVMLTDSEVSGNVAVGYGGGLLNHSGTLTLLRTTVSANQAMGDGWGGGGGIAVVSGLFRMTESTVAENQTLAIDHDFPAAGGLFISQSVWHPNPGPAHDTERLPEPVAIIRHSRVADNLAGTELQHLDGNSTAFAGGILKTGGGRLLIENTAIVGNVARGGYWGYAGGLLVRGDDNIVVNSSILNNVATYRGGGVTAEGSLDLHGVTISRNQIHLGADRYCFETQGADPYPCSGAAGLWARESAVVRVDHTLIADNRLPEPSAPGFVAADCWGALSSIGYSAVGDIDHCSVTSRAPETDLLRVNAQLAEVRYGERPRDVYLLPYSTSPIIDAGKPYEGSEIYSPSCTRRDQIGTLRVDGDRDGTARCDIGAVEYR